ncbi:MAG: hypothetical protein JW682_06595 [Campylobacterales bacterium]|nr:hypothetical protein [Campylobacterales bacterium]HEO98900.1 hypothetical protein [Campylobacterota bacterium]
MNVLALGVVLVSLIGMLLSAFLNAMAFRVIFSSLFIFFNFGLLEHLMLIWDVTYEEYLKIPDNTLRGGSIALAGYLIVSISIYNTYLFNKFLEWFYFSKMDKFILGFLVLSNLLWPIIFYIVESNIPI